SRLMNWGKSLTFGSVWTSSSETGLHPTTCPGLHFHRWDTVNSSTLWGHRLEFELLVAIRSKSGLRHFQANLTVPHGDVRPHADAGCTCYGLSLARESCTTWVSHHDRKDHFASKQTQQVSLNGRRPRVPKSF